MLNIRDLLNKQYIFFDGSMGTLLQREGLKAGELPEMWNITHSDTLVNIHLEYLKSGSNVISANTFGANSLKFNNLEEIIYAAMDNAKKAVEIFGEKDRFVAFDMGPLGKMLEPLGDMPFERAVEIFSENVRLAEKHGADLIIIETMNDGYETKAAVLAATASLGREAALDNVTVNCICPGIIKTSMWEEILDQLAGDDQAERDRVWAEWNKGTPNGKPQEPIDIANMVAFLCTEEARYITSQNIGVDGGYTF